MSRREIRRMLTKRKYSLLDRPGAIPVLMVGVLVIGLMIGVGIGMMTGPKPLPPLPEAREVEDPLPDRPGRRELADIPPDEGPSVVPMAPVPPQRPVPKEEIAALPPLIAPPPLPGKAKEAPAWVRYAVPAPQGGGRPMIAVVIDDLGLDKRRTEKVLTLRAPLTLSFMTYAEDLDRVTAAAHARGHELMVHMPMQPVDGGLNAGPEVLEVGMSADELRRRIDWGLSRFPGFVGINNHMGSRFTADTNGMRVVMEELRRRGLLFLDSVTSERTVGSEVALHAGVPFATRQVFLDNEQSSAAVRAQLERTEAMARKNGYAIAIGHPHDATIEALTHWLPALEAKGFVLVPVSAVVKAHGQHG